MKIAMPSAALAHMQAWPRPTTAMLFRLTGLLIAVSVPTGFWTFALMLATKGAGVAIEPPALAAFSFVVAAWCLVIAALVMDPERGNMRRLVSSSVRR